ncbi:DinB family protein [Teichococcus aestuarii]
MITPEYCRAMAAYNSEMNRRFYAAASRLDEAARTRPRGAFFGSLHGTLCHLVWGDMQWMSRFDGGPPPPAKLPESAGMIRDFAALAAARVALDARIEAWAAGLDAARLAGDLTVQRRRWPRGDPPHGPAGGAFLQPPDASSRPCPCPADGRGCPDRGYGPVPRAVLTRAKRAGGRKLPAPSVFSPRHARETTTCPTFSRARS